MTRRLFEKTLSKTDVEYRLAIPMDSLSAFQAFQIPEGEYSKKVDFFDNNGCRWSFRYSTRKNDPHPKPVLSSGWIKFVKEKGLKEGDQVIFSVSDRDGDEGLQFGIEARKKFDLWGQDFWSDLATTQLSIDLRSRLESPPPAINMTRRLFEKTLSKTDVEYRLAIPMDSLSAFQAFQIPEGEYSKKVDFFDNNGCRWSFRYSTRKNDPHPKPVLSSGWIKFVKEKGLKEGDQVIFSVSDRDGDEGLQFGIEARKKFDLWGQDFWSDLATTQLSIDLRSRLESPPPAINMTRRLFEKTLSKTDVEYRLAIPMDSLSAFQAFQIPEGEYSKKVDFFDNNGCRWSFRYSTRKNDPHPKPVLSSGWIKFVKEKGLNEGDQVIFSVSDKDGAEGLQFGIQARKKVYFLGQDFWSGPL